MSDPACPICGADAVVTVVGQSGDGGTELRQYCRECQRRETERARRDMSPIALSLARLLVYGGVLLSVLALTADYLGISGRPGFGWRQLAGTELGFLAVVLGVVLRKGFLATAGAFLLVLSIGADLLALGHVPGLGWRSHAGFVVAAAMIAGGITWMRAIARGTGVPWPRPARRGSPP
jgi:hypothetical protein